jgi:hypothetical protein
VNSPVGAKVKVPVRENAEESVKNPVGQKTGGTGMCEPVTSKCDAPCVWMSVGRDFENTQRMNWNGGAPFTHEKSEGLSGLSKLQSVMTTTSLLSNRKTEVLALLLRKSVLVIVRLCLTQETVVGPSHFEIIESTISK